MTLGALAVLLSIAKIPVMGQPAVKTLNAFQGADDRTKNETLGALATLRLTIDPSEIEQIVLFSLKDPNPRIRRGALGVVAGRSAGVRGAPTPERVNLWKAERTSLLRTRPALIQAMDDPEPLVRRDGIIALGNLDYEFGQTSVAIRPSNDLLQLLADRVESEASPVVREEIVKAMALAPNRTAVQERVLIRALDDPSDAVRQYAIRGAGLQRIDATLPKLAALLHHQQAALRLSAAVALAQFGPSASAYLPQLREAFAAESDPIVKKTLQGSLDALERR